VSSYGKLFHRVSQITWIFLIILFGAIRYIHDLRVRRFRKRLRRYMERYS
jgi:hypothetical protein